MTRYSFDDHAAAADDHHYHLYDQSSICGPSHVISCRVMRSRGGSLHIVILDGDGYDDDQDGNNDDDDDDDDNDVENVDDVVIDIYHYSAGTAYEY